ncbi:uncharacterized protein LOC127860156 [Dreissena polymorpha]|uniref:3'-5' exonuclease domain-containing protein n=1 Tax=Dreissena polymorpha TaxID=45954 RepID=A0A9D3YIK4_DREPO|nr:uncharacterized protein LOC127860156 [Dreissena polymorpha]XP_052253998.1 uncharacterized protein LOC127860156 [Dreissena polymorpha]XP_052253999.1 uncharacterized protein LOC127860156 [Dreissena polymorpha]XP_052254000.1 uncharacterized protein LOC127860156 [Dreissena polymorpha]KAH3699940.1 hypothetical protein DPMN_074901 [Dreissena polymorpha]
MSEPVSTAQGDSASPTPGHDQRVPDAPPVIRLPCCPRLLHSIEVKPLNPDMVEVVIGTDRCKQIVARLHKEKVIAMAAEGINIGKEGPVTLLQIATCSGHVFLFDVLVNRDLMHQGRLKHVFEDSNVQKVIHDCSRLNAAITYQFSTSLCNVFDTQIAHMVIERHRGRRLPTGLPVSDLCLQYSDSTEKLQTYDWRTQAKTTWMTMVGNFWAMRPLTPDMVEFAACDVIVLIPEVYRHQMEYIVSNGLKKEFTKEVDSWMLIEMDDVIKEKHGRKVITEVTSILHKMDGKYDDRAAVFNILDQDEINALSLCTYEDAEAVSDRVRKLKVTYILKELEDIQRRLRTEAESWEDKENMLEHLRYYQTLKNADIRETASRMFSEIRQAILEHVEEKYGCDSTTNMLTLVERDALLTIPYSEVATGAHGPVTSVVFWRLMEEEIHGMINCLRFSPNQFALTEPEYAKVVFFANDVTGGVPEEVATLATGLMHALRAFNAATGGYSIEEKRRSGASQRVHWLNNIN